MTYTKNSEIKSSTLYCQTHISELFIRPDISKVLSSSDSMEDIIVPQIGIQVLSAAVQQLGFYPQGLQGCFYNEDSKIRLSLGYSTVKENTSLAKSFSRLGLKHPNVDILVRPYEPKTLKIHEVTTLCEDLEETISCKTGVSVKFVEVTIDPSDLSPEGRLKNELSKALSEGIMDSGPSPKVSILGVVETYIETGRIYVSDDIRESLTNKGIKSILHLE